MIIVFVIPLFSLCITTPFCTNGWGEGVGKKDPKLILPHRFYWNGSIQTQQLALELRFGLSVRNVYRNEKVRKS